ncbi:MAG: FkbM family methyltransferase [Bdellovibrionia bacterium]
MVLIILATAGVQMVTYYALKMFHFSRSKFPYFKGIHWPLFLNSWKYLFKEIFQRKSYFFDTEKERPTIIDCGSNVGFSVIFFKKLYPKAKIICFEANPKVFKLLEDCIEKNSYKDVSIYNVALAENEGEKVSFFLDQESSLGSSLFKRKNLNEKVEVFTERLSKYIKGPVDFIKIDIEGAENLVLKELDGSGVLGHILQGVIEFHYLPNNSLATTCEILERNNFEFKIKSGVTPEFSDTVKN